MKESFSDTDGRVEQEYYQFQTPGETVGPDDNHQRAPDENTHYP